MNYELLRIVDMWTTSCSCLRAVNCGHPVCVCLYWKVYYTAHGCNGQITITWSFMDTILPPPPPPSSRKWQITRPHTAYTASQQKHSLQLQYGPHSSHKKHVHYYTATGHRKKGVQWNTPILLPQLERHTHRRPDNRPHSHNKDMQYTAR